MSQLSFALYVSRPEQTRFLANLLCQGAEREQQTGEKILELLLSVCRYKTFPLKHRVDDDFNKEEDIEDCNAYQCDFLLDLYSHVKDYETQTGRRVLPALQPVFQSAPAVWTIHLSDIKASFLLEVLKLQSGKKPVELTGWSYEESEVWSFLKCLPYMSQLSFTRQWSTHSGQTQICGNLFCRAAESEQQTGEKILELLSSVCSYETFPYRFNNDDYRCDFLLDLYSHVKNYETQTVDDDEEKYFIEDRSAYQCDFLLDLCSHVNDYETQTAEREQQTGEKILELLSSVCSYETFPLKQLVDDDDNDEEDIEDLNAYQCDFLLELYSHVKDYETKTGRRVLPALQPVFQSAPAVWTVDLSKRKTSVLLEVLKLQSGKKPVQLTHWSDEESEVWSFLKCLPYMSQLRCDPEFFQFVCTSIYVRSQEVAQQLASLLQLMGFTLVLTGELPRETCWFVGQVLGLCGSSVDLILTPSKISLKGAALIFRHTAQLHSLSIH
ncbi:uncharacterized protein LOC115361954 [Myripristis murdjan]|uniref:uncharacterized protein LOC115361954 n=1 Tax=Myripristis murdjan TaxID=586833 RepID=UPI0011764600|nr:uncharacterized protein LOC115361954 [Myripristis murdjan]